MPVADYSVTSFTLDFEYAVNKAMSYLTKLGHTKIGFLGGREILEVMKFLMMKELRICKILFRTWS